MALRDFIYIDKNRMYSLYSQLFEGVVESLVKSVSYSSEEQKSEKRLEETIIDASVKVQNVVLFDHIYNTLEEKMMPNILVVDNNTTKSDIIPTSILKISGYVTIEDYEHLSYLMDNFNEIGLALANMQLQSKNQTGKQSNNSVEKYAKENGLTLDRKFTSSIVKIIENLHGNSMEIFIETDNESLDLGFKAFLDHEFLRLSPNTLRSLYGYKPCMKWTMVGEVTDISYISERHQGKTKSIFSKMFKQLNDVDHSFSKSTEDSCDTVRIAPIAVYIEHESVTTVSEDTAVQNSNTNHTLKN
ncbi:MAG: hypothetical protein NC177_01545 [Ruminococcus flavefaciens]|nr:hypothetical protein [Ruminococcus flavefaciens]